MEIAAFVFSAVSLVIAIISFAFSIKAQHLQNKVNEMDLKLKQYEIAEKEQEQKVVSCIEARVISIGQGKYRLKIWNSGNTKVTNVSASIKESDGPIIFDNGKQPYDELEPNKNYEMGLITHMGTARKFHIITKWTDIYNQQQEKSQMGDL